VKVIDYHEAIFASDLNTPAKITALAIGSYYNWSEQAMCWPSNKTISQATGLAISTVVKAKKELALAGYLEVWRRIDNSNLYRPLIPHSIPRTLDERGSDVIEKRVYSQSETNNEYNNEVNNETNNERKKDSKESLISISNIHQEDIEPSFEIVTERSSAPAITREEADRLMSW
jgi:hypothetical protein